MSISNKMALSIDEASKHSSIGKTRLYQAINQGELIAKKMGRKTLILSSDLEAFLYGLENYSASEREV